MNPRLDPRRWLRYLLAPLDGPLTLLLLILVGYATVVMVSASPERLGMLALNTGVAFVVMWVAAMNIMMDDLGYGISKRKVTLSTSGVAPMIDELAKVIDVSLALSLHAPNDELRNQLVPINKKYPLAVVLDACKRYISGLGEKRVLTVEYTLLKDVNDQPEHAAQIIELLRNLPCKINLIPFNPFPHSGYERPSNNAIRRFQDLLHHGGFNVTVRTTRGEDIDAACGQLVGQVMN